MVGRETAIHCQCVSWCGSMKSFVEVPQKLKIACGCWWRRQRWWLCPGGGRRGGLARSRDYGGAECPLQDRSGGGRGVRQDSAAAGNRQGRLPRELCPTVFENYTASFKINKCRTELNMWDTSGSSYYDNVRPLAYPDSDAVLICFDISQPETLDSVLKKWQGETQEFCPNAKVVLVGCKLDVRTDLATLRELSKQRLIPVTHEQGTVSYKLLPVFRAQCQGRLPCGHSGFSWPCWP